MKDEKDLQYASLNQMYNELDEMYHAVAVAHKISDCALWILYCVRETSAPLTQSEIADAMFINRQSVNSALRKMEEEGYIVLRTKEDNRKINVFC
ncbi:MAG: MarR family winged helix-turn-helix transcriptional regulator [Candidatus Borkfalkia sp.]